MPETQVNISLKTLNGILGYLGTRPYQEVFQLIAVIQQEVAPKPEDTPPAE